jgi:hypothetical protein
VFIANGVDAACCGTPDNAAEGRRAGCGVLAPACISRGHDRASAQQGSSQGTTDNDAAPVRERETTTLGWA